MNELLCCCCCCLRVCNGQDLKLSAPRDDPNWAPPNLLMGLFGTLMFYDHVSSNAMISLEAAVKMSKMLRSIRVSKGLGLERFDVGHLRLSWLHLNLRRAYQICSTGAEPASKLMFVYVFGQVIELVMDWSLVWIFTPALLDTFIHVIYAYLWRPLYLACVVLSM